MVFGIKLNHACMLFGIIIVFLAMTVFAHAQDNNSFYNGIYIQSENNAVCLEKCTTHLERVLVTNYSSNTRCLEFDLEVKPNDLLDASLMNKNICLNANESVPLALSINSCAAEQRTYSVRIFSFDSNLDISLPVSIGSCNSSGEFRIDEFDGKVCRGEEKKFSVLVRNTSSKDNRIYLSADNSMLLPYFESESVFLASGQQKSVNLVINANNLPLGFEAVTLSGDAGDFHIEKRLNLEIVDCSDVVKRTLVLFVPSICFDVRKGQEFEGRFTITRQSEPGEECFYNKKEFLLSANGLPTELSFSKVSLLANESRQIPFTVQVPTDASAGKHLIYFTASDGEEWNSFRESKSFCLNVLGEQKLGFYVNTQLKDIVQGSTEVFELEAVNNGDLDANYTVAVIDSPGAVSTTLSENHFLIAKGSSKKIFAAISPSVLAQVKNNQSVIVKISGAVEAKAIIYFNVKEKSFLDSLQILSATKELKMKGNSVAEYIIIIRNNSIDDLRNVVVYFENVPLDVNIQSITLDSIKSGGVASVSGTIKAGDINGVFEPVFVVSSGNLVNKQKFVLEISKNPNLGIVGLFAGLFGFSELTFESVFAGVALAAILIVFIWLIINGVLVLTKPSDNEKKVWVK